METAIFDILTTATPFCSINAAGVWSSSNSVERAPVDYDESASFYTRKR